VKLRVPPSLAGRGLVFAIARGSDQPLGAETDMTFAADDDVIVN
jgi:hypothetical protein